MRLSENVNAMMEVKREGLETTVEKVELDFWNMEIKHRNDED